MTASNIKLIIETIIEESTLTAASQKLFITQPYLSKIIKDTETELGIKIFERKYKKMSLTYQGSIYLNYLNQIELLKDKMKHEINMLALEKKGAIKIGINPTLASIFIPILKEINIKYFQDIDIKYFEFDADKIDEMLLNEAIDLVFGLHPLNNTDFETVSLYEDQSYLLVSKSSNLYKEQNRFTISDLPDNISSLNNLPLVLLNDKFGIRKTVNNFYLKNNLKLNIIFETTSIYTCIGLVRKGIGNTIVFKTGMNVIPIKDVNVYRINDGSFNSEWVVYYKKDKIFPQYINEFITISKKYFFDKSQNYYINFKK